MRKLTLILICMSEYLFALPANFEETVWLASGLDASPITMTFSPDGRLFVAQRDGTIRVIKNGKLLATPFLKVSAYQSHRENMIGMAFDPKFKENGYFYLYYQKTDPNRISRFSVSKTNPDSADAGSELVLIEGVGGGNGHNGGAFGFGKDSMLYAASGINGSTGLDGLGGKLIRINPSAYPNIIPKDNPYVGIAGERGEIWASGFREPFTGALDTVTGAVVVNDVGDAAWEEADLIVKGGNYGYPTCEGACANPGFINPWIEYSHSVGSCIAGGTFYHGNQFGAAYQGNYFYADEGQGWVKMRSANGQVQDFSTGGKNVIDVDVGPDGSLYVLRIPGEPPPTPWLGTITRIRNTAATGILRSPAGPNGDTFGPERSIIPAGARSRVRFLLGREPVRSASLRIYDERGRLLQAMEMDRGKSELIWNFNADRAKEGALFYALRAFSENGAAKEKNGTLILLK